MSCFSDFWAYFEPVRLFMASNCSADVQAVVSHVTAIVESGNKEEIQAAKDNWGLGQLVHDLDFLGARTYFCSAFSPVHFLNVRQSDVQCATTSSTGKASSLTRVAVFSLSSATRSKLKMA
jgi:hypothetical protein